MCLNVDDAVITVNNRLPPVTFDYFYSTTFDFCLTTFFRRSLQGMSLQGGSLQGMSNRRTLKEFVPSLCSTSVGHIYSYWSTVGFQRGL